MNTQNEQRVRDDGRSEDLDGFRKDLLDAVLTRVPDNSSQEELAFAFVCEVGSRLADAEEFQDFIPCHFTGTGYRGRKLRVDGYEIDETDDSIRLLIADFNGGTDIVTLTKTRAEAVFSQLKSFVEESASGRILNSPHGDSQQTRELSGLIEQKHGFRGYGSRSTSRYRLYMITDSFLSDRLKDLPIEWIDGVPVEFHIWDIARLRAVSTSILGTEELEIDFRKFVKGGLPCLQTSQTEDYDGYLCVIPGDALTEIYDLYGSRLLEGNVRSFLSTKGKINRGIQGTIRKEPERFFIYNNGITATATEASVEKTEYGDRLVSVTYFQIVNGGQTTASLHVAKHKDKADLASINVQMKLSVVKARDTEMLDNLIQNIARFSNSQNKVSDADFFSNHPFHRAMERRSRAIKAPAAVGAQFNTHWFYERARGQYRNEQSKMTLAQKRAFQRENPRSQLIVKTDLAKNENSWRKLPYIVSRGAQKNFLNFAEYVGKEYGDDGRIFDNDNYFKEMVSRTILFKFIERMVSKAKATWYGGDYRAQIVTYTFSRLIDLIESEAHGYVLNLKSIWTNQGISSALAEQLEIIAKAVSVAITTPPVAQMNVGEWCKKEANWQKVQELQILLLDDLRSELISKEEALNNHIDGKNQGAQDSAINTVMKVVKLSQSGCWARLSQWSQRYLPIYGMEADLVRNASRQGWVPSDRQAAKLIQLLKRMEQEGFRTD
ncbi:MAG TPA: AIPR family protein [Syntrophorhabdus sp.]|nr:AIPR family protein [Syntrophorhabdus sp.]